MAKKQLSGKALQDVHKVVFLINEYSNKTLKEVAQLFQMPAVDINAAVWRAEDLGYLFIDSSTGYAKVEKVPDSDMWKFGPEVQALRELLIYYFKHLARNEVDLEETYLSTLTIGYPAHDLTIVLKQLMAERIIATYTITDRLDLPVSKKARGRGKQPEVREDVYTFYSLWENSEQQWGRKQFKDDTKLK